MKRICLYCEHFKFEAGSAYYSDRTPGFSAEVGCWKNRWEWDSLNDSVARYREKMQSATKCGDYRHYKPADL